jgi:hypothetical protein
MGDILILLIVIVVGVVVGLQSYFLHRQNQELLKKISADKKDIVVQAFPDNPEALAKDADSIPLEEVSDQELKEATENMLKE